MNNLKTQVLDFLKTQGKLLSELYSVYNIEKIADIAVEFKDDTNSIYNKLKDKGEHGTLNDDFIKKDNIARRVSDLVESLTIDESKYTHLDKKIIEALRKHHPESSLLKKQHPTSRIIHRVYHAINMIGNADSDSFYSLDLENPGFGRYLKLDIFDDETKKEIFADCGNMFLEESSVKRPIKCFLMADKLDKIVEILSRNMYSCFDDSGDIKDAVLTVDRKYPEIVKEASDRLTKYFISEISRQGSVWGNEDRMLKGLMTLCLYTNSHENFEELKRFVSEKKWSPKYNNGHYRFEDSIERAQDDFEFLLELEVSKAVFRTENISDKFKELERIKHRFGFYKGLQELIQNKLNDYELSQHDNKKNKDETSTEYEKNRNYRLDLVKSYAKQDLERAVNDIIEFKAPDHFKYVKDIINDQKFICPERELTLLIEGKPLTENDKKVLYDSVQKWMDDEHFRLADIVLCKMNEPKRDKIINKGFEKTYIFY